MSFLPLLFLEIATKNTFNLDNENDDLNIFSFISSINPLSNLKAGSMAKISFLPLSFLDIAMKKNVHLEFGRQPQDIFSSSINILFR